MARSPTQATAHIGSGPRPCRTNGANADKSLKQDPAESAPGAEERKPTGRFSAAEAVPEAQTLSDVDQSVADGDQTSADFDQTAADADDSASERDQLAADRDQVAADDERAAALDHGQVPAARSAGVAARTPSLTGWSANTEPSIRAPRTARTPCAVPATSGAPA